jgi:protein phosphatase
MQTPVATTLSTGLQWSGRTDCGKVRPNNEDAFVGLQFDAQEIHHLGAIGGSPTGHFDYVFAVSDGMGGAKAGEHASRIAVQKITMLMPAAYRHAAMGLAAGFPDILEELFGEIHKDLALLGKCYEECAGMETTLSLCWFTPGRMYFGHIGDSRIYYLPHHGQSLLQVSNDDTHVGWLLRNKKINEREARNHPRRSVLQKALGGRNQFITPQVGAVAFEPGDTFLLCTDGLVDGLFDSQLTETLQSPDAAQDEVNLAQRLVDLSVAATGRDNTTALVVRIV